MKKNKMMRIAAVLLVVTLLSTCAISGTFAKYVTAGSGAGEARVAKWGIEITMTGEDTLFSTQYGTDDDNYAGEFSVVSANTEKVVAPGTKNDNGLTATIKGTPEVATRLYLDLDVNSDIGLDAGNYTDYTTGLDTTDEFNLPVAYYPVKFDIAFNGTIADHQNMSFTLGSLINTANSSTRAGIPALTKPSLTDLANYIDEHNGEYFPVIGGTNAFGLGIEDGKIYVDVPAGKTIDGTFKLSWNWAYEQIAMTDPTDISSTFDKADTFLGMSEKKLDFAFTAAAVQIN